MFSGHSLENPGLALLLYTDGICLNVLTKGTLHFWKNRLTSSWYGIVGGCSRIVNIWTVVFMWYFLYVRQKVHIFWGEGDQPGGRLHKLVIVRTVESMKKDITDLNNWHILFTVGYIVIYSYKCVIGRLVYVTRKRWEPSENLN